MSKPKRQKTVSAVLRDKATGGVLFCSLRVDRRGIALHPTPALYVPGPTGEAWQHQAAVERCEDRALRLGVILRERWFGG